MEETRYHKVVGDHGANDIFRFYKKESKNPHGLTQAQFGNVWKDFAGKIFHEVVFNNYEYKKPFKLGTLSIRKSKIKLKLKEDGTLDTKNIPVDYKATNALWEKDEKAKKNKTLIHIFNEHSDGFLAKVYWDRSICAVKNKSITVFRAARNNKRMVAKAIKNHNIVYYDS